MMHRKTDPTVDAAIASNVDMQKFHYDAQSSNNTDKLGFYALILIALFIVILLLALVAGVNVYRSLYENGDSADNKRLTLSLTANAIRANDAEDAISIVDGPEGSALVLAEHLDTGTYETRIYKSNGFLVQDYVLANSDFNISKATPIAKTSVFDVKLEDPMVYVTTDDGTMGITLRSQNAISKTQDSAEAGRSSDE